MIFNFIPSFTTSEENLVVKEATKCQENNNFKTRILMSQIHESRYCHFPIIVLLFTLLLGTILFSCKKEETEFSYKDLGLFHLLPESIEQLPYKDKSLVVFADSLNNKVNFNIHESDDISTYRSSIHHYNVFEEGDTVIYEYRSETKGILVSNDSLSIKLVIQISANPLYETPDIDVVADILTISYINLNNQNTSTQVFSNVMNPRTWPSYYYTPPINEIEIHGVTFMNVLYNRQTQNKSNTNFNLENGVLSFTDFQGKLWRFDKLL